MEGVLQSAIAMSPGDRFTLREGGKTVVCDKRDVLNDPRRPLDLSPDAGDRRGREVRLERSLNTLTPAEV